MRAINAVSIVVPTLNEVDNVLPLIERIHAAMAEASIRYEIIIVDDHSSDGTVERIKQVMPLYPVNYQLKRGRRGKAYSLQQGFTLAQYNVICMIDADLQYPPEAIPAMYRLLQTHNSDIIITKRLAHDIGRLRKLSTAVFNYLFVNLLFGFDYDSQSGLKLFRKQVLDTITMSSSRWGFDLEFIVRSLEAGFKILPYDIAFSARHSGKAKLNLFSATIELMIESLKLRANSSGKKLRRAYQANMRFMQQVFGMLLATTIISRLFLK